MRSHPDEGVNMLCEVGFQVESISGGHGEDLILGPEANLNLVLESEAAMAQVTFEEKFVENLHFVTSKIWKDVIFGPDVILELGLQV